MNFVIKLVESIRLVLAQLKLNAIDHRGNVTSNWIVTFVNPWSWCCNALQFSHANKYIRHYCNEMGRCSSPMFTSVTSMEIDNVNCWFGGHDGFGARPILHESIANKVQKLITFHVTCWQLSLSTRVILCYYFMLSSFIK